MANIEQKFREACKESGLASMLTQLNNAALNGLVASTLNILKQKAGANTVTGVIKSIGNTTNVAKQAGKEYNKRDLVLDISRFDSQTGEKYENFFQLTFSRKHCADLDGFAVGERVEVSFVVGGREWNGKVINDIAGYKIERVDGGSAPQAPKAPQAVAPQPVSVPVQAPAAEAQQTAQQGNGDLPF